MNQSIRVGIITEATGGHLKGYLRRLATHEGIEYVAIADETGKMFEQAQQTLGPRAATLQTYSSYQEMLAKVRPHAVVVTVEAHRAPERIAAALESGAHTLTEKPPCVNLEDYERVARLADSRKLHLVMGFASRRHPAAVKARELVRNGYIGRPYGTTLNWIGDQTRLTRPAYHQSWLSFRSKAGGGKLIFHGIHYLDLIQYITGDNITQVAGFTRNVGGQPIEVEDAAVVTLGFSKGMVGTLNTGYYLDRGYDNKIVLWGSKGWLRIDLPGNPPLKYLSTHPDAPRGVTKVPTPSQTDDYVAITTNFLDVARGLAEPFMTTAEGLHVMKVVFAAYQAANTGIAQRIA